MKVGVLILVFLFSLQCFSKPLEFGSGSKEAIDVSIYYLLSNPEKLNGKLVRFSGVITLEFEGKAIYSDRESFKYFISKNAFSLDLQSSGLVLTKEQEESIYGKYVEIEGVFHGNLIKEPSCLLKQNCIRIGVSYAGRLSNIKLIREYVALR